MLRFKLIILIISIISLSASDTAAKRQRTTRKALKSAVSNGKHTSVAGNDTVWTESDNVSIRISGYDKPLRSTSESMFISNNTTDTLTAVGLNLNYYDSKKRQLHSRTVSIKCTIPPSQTRQANIQSWDRQHSFYYRLSSVPRKAAGVPYDVTCKVVYYVK
ncbi:MAG: hypothetical protein K2M94_03050 [Paramuribaculum sp.]|nr:hypothetical protein [Paramuribaculum sp.]